MTWVARGRWDGLGKEAQTDSAGWEPSASPWHAPAVLPEQIPSAPASVNLLGAGELTCRHHPPADDTGFQEGGTGGRGVADLYALICSLFPFFFVPLTDADRPLQLPYPAFLHGFPLY